MHADTSQLSKIARRAVEKSDRIAVSAASVYEIRQKAQLGTWKQAARYAEADLTAMIKAVGIDLLPITGNIMDRACDFGWHHRDPFDRIILATARTRALSVVSSDEAWDQFAWHGYERIW